MRNQLNKALGITFIISSFYIAVYLISGITGKLSWENIASLFLLFVVLQHGIDLIYTSFKKEASTRQNKHKDEKK